MKIIQVFPGKIWGGAEQYILDLGKALQQSGHEVLYVARDCPALRQRLNGHTDFVTFKFRHSLNIGFLFSFSHYLKQQKVDVIHIHDTRFVPVTVGAAILSHSNAKIVLTRHIARGTMVNPLFRLFYHRLHNIIFVSQLAQSLWMRANPWIKSDCCHAVLNSIPDTSCKTTCSLRERYHLPANIPLLVYTGRVRKSKGCEVLLKALSHIQHLPFCMVFIGACKPADYDHHLMKLARKLGIADRVHFYGFSSNVRALIQQSDIGVVPSIVREACHLAPMEFMKEGKCVITTNNGAQPEYIENGKTGLLIAPDNVHELATALIEVIEHKDLRTTLGENARIYFNEHLRYQRFYRSLTAYY